MGVKANPDIYFAAVHLLPKGIGKLVFSNGSDNPIPAHLEALLGQWSDREISLRGLLNIYQVYWSTVKCIYALLIYGAIYLQNVVDITHHFLPIFCIKLQGYIPPNVEIGRIFRYFSPIIYDPFCIHVA
jgi:hypothetical protein